MQRDQGRGEAHESEGSRMGYTTRIALVSAALLALLLVVIGLAILYFVVKYILKKRRERKEAENY